MRKKILIPALFAGLFARAAQSPDPDIVVFVHHASQYATVVTTAEVQAQRMLASVGIAVVFRLGKSNYQGTAEVIEAAVINRRDVTAKPGVLGVTDLGVRSGTRVEIFYNRIRAGGGDSQAASVLAHVLVHEITHVLEGVKRHSETGIMKAHWEAKDWRAIRCAPLPFADDDIRLIHAWAAHHHQLLMAGQPLMAGVH
jgi:hypothetical protein